MTEPFVLWLSWRCLECGWQITMAAPGFAGDGVWHYEQPDNRRCGPLCATKAFPREIAAEKARVQPAFGPAVGGPPTTKETR